MESGRYESLALTPGDVRPSRSEQMAMLRNLIAERFPLRFHREQTTFSSYLLEGEKGGAKLKESTAPPGDPEALVSTVFPGRGLLPARNATMGQFTSLLQRALLDRPVVDKTGLAAKYDFDLEWAPGETQFGGDLPPAPTDAASPPFFIAIQRQLGLRLEPAQGPVDTLVVDTVEKSSANCGRFPGCGGARKLPERVTKFAKKCNSIVCMFLA